MVTLDHIITNFIWPEEIAVTSQLWMLHALKRDYWRTILVSTHFTSSPSGLKTAISLMRFHRFKSPQAAKTIPDSLIVGYRPPLSKGAPMSCRESAEGAGIRAIIRGVIKINYSKYLGTMTSNL